MIRRGEKDVAALMVNGEELDRAMATAQIEALRRHRLLGLPIVTWRDGRVAIVPADEIVIPGESDAKP